MSHNQSAEPPRFIVSTVAELLEALAEARPGDTIELRPGVYELEAALVIGQAASLSCTQAEA